MVEESLKEILLNQKPGDFDKIVHHVITNEDVKDFYNLYEEVLQLLANNDSLQYEIKTITYSTINSIDRYGYRTMDRCSEKITILALKENLEKLDNITVLTQKMLMEIYQQGSSMVIVGNDDYMTKGLKLPNQQILGYYQSMVCYLQDDELAHAISMLISFIEENGTDFEQISSNDLANSIKGTYQKQKTYQ